MDLTYMGIHSHGDRVVEISLVGIRSELGSSESVPWEHWVEESPRSIDNI